MISYVLDFAFVSFLGFVLLGAVSHPGSVEFADQ